MRQGSVFGPTLYLLYTQVILHDENAIMVTFADDTAVLAVGENIDNATDELQIAMNKVSG